MWHAGTVQLALEEELTLCVVGVHVTRHLENAMHSQPPFNHAVSVWCADLLSRGRVVECATEDVLNVVAEQGANACTGVDDVKRLYHCHEAGWNELGCSEVGVGVG
jgi:hypothetical protein